MRIKITSIPTNNRNASHWHQWGGNMPQSLIPNDYIEAIAPEEKEYMPLNVLINSPKDAEGRPIHATPITDENNNVIGFEPSNATIASGAGSGAGLLFNDKGLIPGDYSKVYSDKNFRPPKSQYGKPEYYTDFYFKDSKGQWKYKPGVHEMYNGLTQDWFDAVSKLPEFQELKHKPESLEQAKKWLLDDYSTDETIQDWHSFVHSLRMRGEAPVYERSTTPEGRPNYNTAEEVSSNTIDDTYIPESIPLWNTDWFLPAMSAFGQAGYPDYSNARRTERAILPPNLIGYDPNGRYMKPLLADQRYIASKLGNQNAAAIGAAKDLSGSNRATALSNIALNNYVNNLAIGQAMAQVNDANNAAIKEAVALNNQVDRANAEGMFQADRANQSVLESYANRYATQKTKGAIMREEIDEQIAKNRSENWNNFLENMQGFFENQRNLNMANSAYQGTGYWIDKSGTIHYSAKNPSSKTQKEAENRAKEIQKKNQNTEG